LHAPPGFDLDLTARSHGFYDLVPWSYDERRRVLGRPFAVGEGAVYVEAAPAEPAGPGLAVRVLALGRPGAQAVREAKQALRRCLSLDEDLAPFHRRVEELAASGRGPDLRWASRRGAGRLLRSPTVYEDAVKTLCTTNCTWAVTRGLVSRLVATLGRPAPLGTRCFPDPAAMAERPERFYRDEIRAGYRAPFLRELARSVAAGEVDLEAWRHAPRSTDALAREIRALPGFGPYATEHLLRLLGRHDHLALDSWTRAKVARILGRRRPMTDRAIARRYAPFGEWAGLALWLEATADWHGDVPSSPPPRPPAEGAG
jgi:N-glycosylase/DNA lyase